MEIRKESTASKYTGKSVHIDVLTDIIQSEGGAAAEAWGVNVTNSTVSP